MGAYGIGIFGFVWNSALYIDDVYDSYCIGVVTLLEGHNGDVAIVMTLTIIRYSVDCKEI